MSQESESVLPSLQSTDYEMGGISNRAEAVFIKDYTLSGNTVISSESIHSIVTPYINRYLSFEELSQLRDALTLVYVQRGYISSGAEMPIINQAEGTLHINFIEGVLVELRVKNQGRLRKSYIRKRLANIDETIVNINIEIGVR